VTLSDLRAVGFPYHISKRQLAELLSERHGDRNWDRVFMMRGKFSEQKRLETTVASLFQVCILFIFLFLVNMLIVNYCRELK